MYRKITRRPIINLTAKSIQYTFKDGRKLASLLIIVTLPLVGKVWEFVPEHVEFPHYGSLQTFLWAFSINFICVLVSVAWFLTIHRRDFALQTIALVAIFYGVFMTYDTLPFTQKTPLWLDISATFCIFLGVAVYLYYIHKNYLHRAVDYKVLHDGIVHDLHHQRFLGEISRIEGLIEIAEMEEPYRTMSKKEIAKLKESVTYIAEKYKELK
jgi:hypothetical protein